MAIKIGDNNKIIRSIIAENITASEAEDKDNFVTRHPILSTVIITVITGLITGLILMFKFWQQIIVYIEKVIGG